MLSPNMRVRSQYWLAAALVLLVSMLLLAVLLAGCSRGAPSSTPTAQPVSQSAAIGLAVTSVFTERLASAWTTGDSWGIASIEQIARAHGGSRSLLVSPQAESGGLFFAVRPNNAASFLRSNILAVRFWINPDEALNPDQLAVAVVGSDKRPYWSKDDVSVPQQDVAYGGDTRLTYLGFSQPLPPKTWTSVEVWLNKLPAQPQTRYLTGFYLKFDGAAQRTFYVDDVALISIPDTAPPAPLQAACNDLTACLVTFNEDLDAKTAAESRNFRIGSKDDPAYASPQAPKAVAYDATRTAVRLTLPTALKPGVGYTVQVSGIADVAAPPNVMAQPVTIAFTAQALVIRVDAAANAHRISPWIYGVSGASKEYLLALRPALNSWGGNPSTRYNWELGHAWNAGSDWEYRNGNYGYKGESASDDFISDTLAADAVPRMTLPTLGWVAKNDDNNTCSFPTADGKCSNAGGANCEKPGEIADPNRANVPSDVDAIVRWVEHLLDEKQFAVPFFAMDNEPDVWGYTHYDVHPKCTTYDEILSKYLEYAMAVRAVAPEAELLGPVSCCWHFYWNSAAGLVDKLKHSNKDFLPWFLAEVRKHDAEAGLRTLDVLDIHYYPAGLYTDQVDAKIAASRLASTRSLWDKTFVDESWIGQAVYLIPRMKQLIAENYPGVKLFISEWNWGAEKTMNGALAIADVLGIFGREDLYGAAYWRHPPLGSPGFLAFKLYTNYDDEGGRFGDTSVAAVVSGAAAAASKLGQAAAPGAGDGLVSAYASTDSETGKLYVMLLNKDPLNDADATLELAGFQPQESAMLYRYSQAKIGEIVQEAVMVGPRTRIKLPAYSITLLVAEPE